MRALLSLLLVFCAFLALPETLPFQTTPPPSPDEVLNFLGGMGLSPEFTAAFSFALLSGFKSGRVTTTVTLLLLQDLAKIPKEQAEEILEIIRYALSQGFIVDPGLTGSSMMNEVRKLLALGRSAPEIVQVLGARLRFLLATRSVLASRGLIPALIPSPEAPLTNSDRLILEVAWAVGDFILWEGGNPNDPRFLGYVQGRLNRLCALGVLPMDVIREVSNSLTQEVLAEITRLAFQPERR